MTELLSAVEAAEILGCSDTLVRKRITAGLLKATKVGGTWRISRSVLDEQEIEPNRTEPRTTRADRNEPDRTGLDNAQQNRNEPDEADSDLVSQGPMLPVDHILLEQIADLRAQVVQHLADKANMAAERSESERDHDERLSDLREAVATQTHRAEALETELRDTLRYSEQRTADLANRIAGLVEQVEDTRGRVIELQPVAERVPMLEAAVDETKTRLHETEGDLVERDKKLFERERQLADISEDIETIASRPVAGPVFRLLTKGKLRI